MDKNTKIVIGAGIVILVIVALIASCSSQMGNKANAPANPNATTQTKTTTTKTEPAPVTTSTFEGSVTALGEKDVSVKNDTTELLFSISAATPVVKINKDQTETLVGLAALTKGTDVKVTYKTGDKDTKTAEKIYVMGK